MKAEIVGACGAIFLMMFRSTFSHRVAPDSCSFPSSSPNGCASVHNGRRACGVSSTSATASVRCLAVFVFLCGQALFPRSGRAEQTVADRVSELLRQQIEDWKTPPLAPEAMLAPSETGAPSAVPDATAPTNAPAPPLTIAPTTPAWAPPQPPAQLPRAKLMVGKEVLRSATMLARFYEQRAYQPAWSNDAELSPQADALIETIQAEAEREGLQVGDYRLAKLRVFLQTLRQETLPASDPQEIANVDLLLTDTFLTYGAQVALGKTNLKGLDAEWFVKQQRTDLVAVLQQALAEGRIGDALRTLPPQHPGYVKLRAALARYRSLAARGGWPTVAGGVVLRPGEHDVRIAQLRARLQVTGELGASPMRRPHVLHGVHGADDDVYDTALVSAVKKFQQRHGLQPDGVIGESSLAALNVPVETRLRQLVVNMHRWRTLPPNLGARYVEVNVPNFILTVVDHDRPVLTMKVVVGKMLEQRSTPTFSAYMTHVVLNPYWYVPKSIAEKELFPLSRKDPNYFTKNNFVLRRVEVSGKSPTDPNVADGSTTAAKVYQYLLRQKPGPKNALGRVKFMFPNAYGVYLHDTPSKELFRRVVRTFSHGCIRVEKPIDLAEYVLRDSAQWSRETILAAIEQQKPKTVWLSEALPVYIQYWTAWVDDDGAVQFRNDIYGYDNVPGAQLPVTIVRRPQPPPAPDARPTALQGQPLLLPLSQPAEARPN